MLETKRPTARRWFRRTRLQGAGDLTCILFAIRLLCVRLDPLTASRNYLLIVTCREAYLSRLSRELSLCRETMMMQSSPQSRTIPQCCDLRSCVFVSPIVDGRLLCCSHHLSSRFVVIVTIGQELLTQFKCRVDKVEDNVLQVLGRQTINVVAVTQDNLLLPVCLANTEASSTCFDWKRECE